jgi:hypothetical protein
MHPSGGLPTGLPVALCSRYSVTSATFATNYHITLNILVNCVRSDLNYGKKPETQSYVWITKRLLPKVLNQDPHTAERGCNEKILVTGTRLPEM